jgi:hypothetical protein
MHQSPQSESIVRTVNAYQISTRCIRCFVLRLRIVIDVKLDLIHRGVTNFARPQKSRNRARRRSVHGTKLRGTTNVWSSPPDYRQSPTGPNGLCAQGRLCLS